MQRDVMLIEDVNREYFFVEVDTLKNTRFMLTIVD